MTNDAMTTADAARERLFALLAEYAPLDGPESVEVDAVLQAYGDRRAVEAEIAALRAVCEKQGCRCDEIVRDEVTDKDDDPFEFVSCAAHIALADAEQRERVMG